MSTAVYLVGKGIKLQIDENEACSLFGLTLHNGQKELKTTKQLIPHVDAEFLNAVDRVGLSALGYAASLSMHANAKLGKKNHFSILANSSPTKYARRRNRRTTTAT